MSTPYSLPAGQRPTGGAPSPTGADGGDDDVWAALARPPASAPAGWALLLTIARALPASYPPVVHGMLTEPEVRAPLARLCGAIRDALDGRAPVIGDSQALLPLRPLLDALRHGMLSADGEAAPDGTLPEARATGGTLPEAEATDVLPVLRALERVQTALADDSAQRFAERLAEADAMNLVVEVAHDMRSPLGSILFLVERLRRAQSGPVNTVQERQLGLIYSAAFGLSSLASDVMELARGGDRLVYGPPIPFSAQEIFQQVHDIVVPMAEEKGLALRMETLEGDWRVGHPQALQRTLLNLVTNALKFTNEGSVALVARALDRTRVEFSVTDSGRGIPPHVLATLFDAFRRRQQPGDYAFSSAGLGLSICRKLINGLGGELEVESELERGTRFRFVVELPPAPRL
ncbi:MAG: sensor histidine kinase [Gemmatimonadaceae bacterium]